MSCVGIIAEYNPFHNGHLYHIDQARRLSGARYVIAVMSGNFVQRGEVAAFDKFTRTRHALMCGADMVLELPTVFALSCAQRFASAGVRIIAGTGIVDSLCFGSESGDISAIQRAAALLHGEQANLSAAIMSNLKSGRSYPDALARAMSDGDEALYTLLQSPNDVLGIEYVKAISAYGSLLKPYAVKREGIAHDGDDASANFASAKLIRSATISGKLDTIANVMPAAVFEDILKLIRSGAAPRENANFSSAILYALRRMDAQELSLIPDVSEGLENLIFRAARSETTYSGLLAAIKTRRYTLSRIKRILMCALLGITKNTADLDALYIRVLGVKKSSACLLSDMSKAATLPIIVKYSDCAKLNSRSAHMHNIDNHASAIAALAGPLPCPAPFDYSLPLITI
ncbi:MAG: nucleotidyltransferase family protein [Clostridia bacterium]